MAERQSVSRNFTVAMEFSTDLDPSDFQKIFELTSNTKIEIISWKSSFEFIDTFKLFYEKSSELDIKKIGPKKIGRNILWLLRCLRNNSLRLIVLKLFIRQKILIKCITNDTVISFPSFIRLIEEISLKENLKLYCNNNLNLSMFYSGFFEHNLIALCKNLTSADLILFKLEILDKNLESNTSSKSYSGTIFQSEHGGSNFFDFIPLQNQSFYGSITVNNQTQSAIKLASFADGKLQITPFPKLFEAPKVKFSNGYFIPYVESHFHKINNSLLALFEREIQNSSSPVYFSTDWLPFKAIIHQIIEKTRIVWLSNTVAYTFDSISIPMYKMYPEKSAWTAEDHVNPNFKQFSESSKRIWNYFSFSNFSEKNYFIQRPDDSLRSIKNINALKTKLVNLNFQILQPEFFSIEDQVKIFSNMNILVATSGASLTNLSFMQKGSHLIHIYGHDEISKTWEQLCLLLEISYYRIFSTKAFGINHLIDNGSGVISSKEIKRLLNHVSTLKFV